MDGTKPQDITRSRTPSTWAIAAAIVAYAALFRAENGSLFLPLAGCLTLLSVFVAVRIHDRLPLNWLLRLLMFSVVYLLNNSRPPDTLNIFESRTMGWLGEFCAAELTLRCWLRLERPGHRSGLLMLSCFVLMTASCAQEDYWLLFLAPVYFGFLLLAIRHASPQSASAASPLRNRSVFQFAAAVLGVLALGAGINAGVRQYRNALTNWGMKIIGDRQIREAGALSISPQLTSTFGNEGALNRVLQLEGEGDFAHLRGIVYTQYNRGAWGPPAQSYRFVSVPIESLAPAGAGPTVHVIRLIDNYGIVFAPLNCAGLTFPDASNVSEASGGSRVLHVKAPVPDEYDISTSDKEDTQGPLANPPATKQITELLTVPAEIAPGVRLIAARIAAGKQTGGAKLTAIQSFLSTNNHYSLKVHIGPGDPVSQFLLEKKSAHCEFFASAAVILARLMGIPTRYVIGYYAHEAASPSVTVVRQRDAHAWAECWVEGTGWVVLDATPADGRPDQRAKPIPSGVRFVEWVESQVTRLRVWLGSGGLWKVARGGAVLAIVLLSIQAVLSLRRARRASNVFQYTFSDAELAAYYKQFEALGKKRGLVCPASLTWEEYLGRYKAEGKGDTKHGKALIAAMEAFLRVYNAARFGGAPKVQAAPEMQALLKRIETDAHAHKTVLPTVEAERGDE